MVTQPILVDTLPLLHQCLQDIAPSAAATSTTIFVDAEGINLCRQGKISIVQLRASGSPNVWLLDVIVLGQQAFDETDERGKSVKGVLEDPGVKKLLYDVRNDGDALYNLHGVYMQNVFDLQLLELAVRYHTNQRTRLLNGLGRTIDSHLSLPSGCGKIKAEGRALFAPELGGTYEVFVRRPLDPRLVAYCAQDVALLGELEEKLLATLERVSKATGAEEESMDPTLKPLVGVIDLDATDTLAQLSVWCIIVLYDPGPTNTPSPAPTHSASALSPPAPTRNPFPFMHKPNTLDRDRIVVPAGLGSWGEIGALGDRFEARVWDKA
ncbi:ribonuclease H-like domain-containing protein [Infundibulicybe gibba]|nr:ribonuclease H-like domain-containing protein [Infundibulicybe gibba]